MSNQVTLKQIAALAGVSITTVHRVLNNKEGCSEELKAKILRIAQEQGYRVNYAAAAMSKHTLHLGAVFPANFPGHDWFVQRMINGYLHARREASRFNVVFQEHYVDLTTSQSDMARVLRDTINDRPVPCDGLLLYAIDYDDKMLGQLQRLLGHGTPVVMLEKGPSRVDGLCRVLAGDETAGRLAAELMARFLHGGGSIGLIAQQLHGGDPCALAFTDELAALRPDLTVCTLELPSIAWQQDAVREFLNARPDLQGVYATCARHSASYLAALPALSRRPAVAIGSELFEQTHAALLGGDLAAVIDKRPFTLGYFGLQTLFDHVVKNEPLPPVVEIPPRVILRANCDTTYNRKDSIYG